MTNGEYYEKEIIELALNGCIIAVDKDTGRPCDCNGTPYLSCAFFDGGNGGCENCKEKRHEWFNDEYNEFTKWRNLPIDTLVYVRDEDDEVWRPRYFAGFTDKFSVQFPFSTWSNGASSITTEYEEKEYWRQIKLYNGEAD